MYNTKLYLVNIVFPFSRIGMIDYYKEYFKSLKVPENVFVYVYFVIDGKLNDKYGQIQHIFEDLGRNDYNLIISLIINNKAKNIAGHSSRNLVLDILTSHEKQKEQWIFNLDDDTIFHPSFFSLFSLSEIDTADIICFSQLDKSGNIRLHACDGCAKPCHIDTGMVMFRVKTVGDLRFNESDYCADGLFFEQLFNNTENDKITYIDYPHSYYNYLR